MRRIAARLLHIGFSLSLIPATGVAPARAFDPIAWARGLIVGKADGTDAQAGQKTAFDASITLAGDYAALRKPLEQAAQLLAGGGKGEIQPDLLASRARTDVGRLRAALYEVGHFAGEIAVTIAGQPLPAPGSALPATVPGERLVVRYDVNPGPLFLFGAIRIDVGEAQSASGIPDLATLGLVEGAPASSKVLVRAIDKLIEAWRQAGHPLARLEGKDIRADHVRNRLDVSVRIEPGPPAQLGWVNLTGAAAIDDDLVRRYGGLEPGQRYDPAALGKASTRLRKLPAIESVRIHEGNAVDHDGGIPLTITVTERKPRYFGATTSMSTIDGGEAKAYWGHHNLFGGAESFRIEGGVSQIGNGGAEELQYFAKSTLTKPALFDVATDLVLEGGIGKEHLESYKSHAATLKVGLSHKYNETTSAIVGLAGSVAEESDAIATRTDVAVSLPATITEDNRDNRLDPARGWRAHVAIEPTHEFQRGESYVTARGQITGYQSFDAEQRFVVASRLTAAWLLGADAEDVRPSHRLYAGGGGSVRGFAYRSIAPVLVNGAEGGASLIEASLEFRMRFTPSIGLVPFIDAASVSGNAWPGGDAIKVGVGVGLRYYTALGPLRLDIATPLGDHRGQPDVSFYVGLGQAF